MKILFITDSIDCWKHGIWFHRQEMPSIALSLRGHAIKQVAMGVTFSTQLMEWPDTVIFGRAYSTHFDPVKIMRDYKKLGKRVIYDMDDDFWEIAKDNPSVLVGNAMKDQYEGMIKEADAVITPSKVLAKKFKKYFKKDIFICPNGIDPEIYQERPHTQKELVIGYMGASSHWADLGIIADVISDLSKKHNFIFTIYGLVGEPFEAAIYSYRKILADKTMPEKENFFKTAIAFYDKLKNVKLWHVPFMPPQLHPTVLSRCDIDIGIAPLIDNTFNRGKSCVKYYEYASTGTVTIASDVLPYFDEVGYCAKNTYKDWYKKLEKLILDTEFRNKLLKKQKDWVLKNRTVEFIALPWELACQKPSKLSTLNQR